jgi:hypothetical protein
VAGDHVSGVTGELLVGGEGEALLDDRGVQACRGGDHAHVVLRERDDGHALALKFLGGLPEPPGVVDQLAEVEAAMGKDAHDHLAAGHALDAFVPITEAPPKIVVSTEDTAGLLHEIPKMIERFVALSSEHQAVALALWTAHTYVLDAAEQTPYLIVTAPEKRCGKSRLLEVLEVISRQGQKIDSAPSEASLFRMIEKERPTLLLDEFDRLLKGPKDRTEPIIAVLNGGNRQEDAWEILLAIADLVGGDWPARARAAATALCSTVDPEDDSLGVRLLADVRTVIADASKIATTDLLAGLHDLDETPWADLNGRPLNARKLATLLRPYSIRSRSVRLDDGSTPKGFKRDQFGDAWSRYLRSSGTVAATPATTAAQSQTQAVPDPPQDSDGGG